MIDQALLQKYLEVFGIQTYSDPKGSSSYIRERKS